MFEKFFKVTLSLLRGSAWAKQNSKFNSKSIKFGALHVKNDNIFYLVGVVRWRPDGKYNLLIEYVPFY